MEYVYRKTFKVFWPTNYSPINYFLHFLQLEQTLEDQEQEQNEGDTTIEVPVDFEQENTEEDEEVYEPPMSEINDEKHETSIELKEEINATIEDDDDDDDDDDDAP